MAFEAHDAVLVQKGVRIRAVFDQRLKEFAGSAGRRCT